MLFNLKCVICVYIGDGFKDINLSFDFLMCLYSKFIFFLCLFFLYVRIMIGCFDMFIDFYLILGLFL